MSQESVDDLNTRLDAEDKVTFENFRPNIVVHGVPPFAEDEWKIVNVGTHRFYITSRCTRCQVPCVNVETGTIGKEPSRTMMKNWYRRVDPGSKFEACFGVNALSGKEGLDAPISVDDVFVVKETTTKHNVKIGIWQPRKIFDESSGNSNQVEERNPSF